MITELYVVVAILCDRRDDCVQRTVWSGKDRTECMAQAVQVRVNPPSYVNHTKMSACLVERMKPGYEWSDRYGYWRKIRD